MKAVIILCLTLEKSTHTKKKTKSAVEVQTGDSKLSMSLPIEMNSIGKSKVKKDAGK